MIMPAGVLIDAVCEDKSSVPDPKVFGPSGSVPLVRGSVSDLDLSIIKQK
jgi:hypothetical protein